jgi:Zn-dependent protease with chaperone function
VIPARTLLTAFVALAPGITAWWTGRRLERAGDDPALPELILTRNQRIHPVLATTLALLIVLAGGALYWALPLIVAGMLAGSYPLRRALGIETAGLGRYFWRSVKSIIGSVGFWILLAWTPQIVLAIDPRFRWASLALALVLVLWEWRYPRIWLWLHDSVPLVNEALSARFTAIAERAGIAPPAVYRIGAPDARFTNAFAFPSVRQPAIGLGNSLIELLEPDETAAIYAHELAHIEHFGARRIGWLQLMNRLLIVLAVAIPLLAQAYLPSLLSWIPIVWPLVVIGALLARARTRQREEHDSDLRAAALCGDPEAVVRGLIKVHVHGFLPRRWPVNFERNASHPSLARRIQALRGEATTATPSSGAPVVLATARDGSVVVFDDARGHWFDGVPQGTPGNLDALRLGASSVRSVAWNDLVELRVTAYGSDRALRATHRNGDAWSVPIAADQVAPVQRALDTVDVRLHRELGRTPVFTVRLVGALSVLALLLTMQFGFVVVPAALALFWPSVAAAAALGVSALLRAGLNVVLNEGPEYFITPAVATAVLLAIAAGALWLAWRGYRRQRALSSDTTTLAVLGIALLLMIVAFGFSPSGMHLSQLVQSTGLATLCVAAGGLAAALLVSSARWARWTGLGTMAIALVAGGIRTRAVDAEPAMTSSPASAVEAGQVALEGTITDLRLSPDGTRYLVQRFEQSASRRRSGLSYLVGTFAGTQRQLADAVGAAFADDSHILALRTAGDSLVLQLERADRDSVLWTAALPEIFEARLSVSPRDGTWTVTGELPTDSAFAGSGSISSPAIEARHLAPFEETATVDLLVFDAGATLIATAMEIETRLPAPLMMLGLSTPNVGLWQITSTGRRRTGEVPGFPQCGVPDAGSAACFVRGRGRGNVYTLGADGVPHARGALPNAETYLIVPGPGSRLTATDRATRVLDVDADAGRVTEIRLPAGQGFVMAASVSAERLALVRQDSSSARLVWYRVNSGQ